MASNQTVRYQETLQAQNKKVNSDKKEIVNAGYVAAHQQFNQQVADLRSLFKALRAKLQKAINARNEPVNSEPSVVDSDARRYSEKASTLAAELRSVEERAQIIRQEWATADGELKDKLLKESQAAQDTAEQLFADEFSDNPAVLEAYRSLTPSLAPSYENFQRVAEESSEIDETLPLSEAFQGGGSACSAAQFAMRRDFLTEFRMATAISLMLDGALTPSTARNAAQRLADAGITDGLEQSVARSQASIGAAIEIVEAAIESLGPLEQATSNVQSSVGILEISPTANREIEQSQQAGVSVGARVAG